MSLLAALLLAATARVEAVSLTAVDSQLAVRVTLSGKPGMVSVHREANAARVSVADAALGSRFSGGQRFSWTPTHSFDAAALAAPARLDRLEVVAAPSEVSVLLHVPPDVSIDVRRDRRGLLLVFRRAGAEDTRVAATPLVRSPPTPGDEPGGQEPAEDTAARAAERPAEPARPPTPEPTPTIAAAEPVPTPPQPTAGRPAEPARTPTPETEPTVATAEPTPTPPGPDRPSEATPPPLPDLLESAETPSPSPDTLELARGLFPAPAGPVEPPDPTVRASVGELYGRLFPTGAPQTEPETVVVPSVEPVGPEQGVAVGPFRVQLGIDARYVDADTFVESTGVPVRDRYLEVAPRIAADAPVSEGRLTLGYLPTLRAFATYEDVNSSSHRLSAGIDLPVGPSVRLRAKDTFVVGLLDTREVDPGGEYFFDLGRFHRNNLDGGASILVGPRMSLELGGSLSSVRFQERSSFFDYDARAASAGLGYELTPTLKAVASYVYDQVPTPPDRSQAEASAHSGQVSFIGDIGPLLSGTLSFGYRIQKSPNAGADGTRYSGFVMSGSLSRQFSPESSFTLFLNRSTPVSAFEENAFYVTTGIQGAGRVPLPLQLQLLGGLGYQWNDYRTVAEDIGAPREDRILAVYVGLRRPVRRQFFVSASYRREERRSNLDQFDTNTDGFFLQLEWDIFGSAPR